MLKIKPLQNGLWERLTLVLIVCPHTHTDTDLVVSSPLAQLWMQGNCCSATELRQVSVLLRLGTGGGGADRLQNKVIKRRDNKTSWLSKVSWPRQNSLNKNRWPHHWRIYSFKGTASPDWCKGQVIEVRTRSTLVGNYPEVIVKNVVRHLNT
jgi:hypothetical protein